MDHHSSTTYISAGSIESYTFFDAVVRFIKNIGTAVHLISSTFVLGSDVMFNSNSANNGAAMYLEGNTQIHFDDKQKDHISVQFCYICRPYFQVFKHGVVFYSQSNLSTLSIYFMKNSAGIIGNSMYFNVHQHCKIVSDPSRNTSVLHLPYKFYYNRSYSTAIGSSPHSVILYFEDATIESNTYHITHQVLGRPISFGGHMLDYFNNSAAPTQFDVQCYDNCADVELTSNRVLIDNTNTSTLSLILTSKQIVSTGHNVSLKLTSILETFNKKISASIVVGLVPCTPGYYYNKAYNCCACYHHQDIVECHNYNEIKRGYWFGIVEVHDRNITTVSLCPSRYCEFGNKRKETRQGYCIIPQQYDNQCRPHRIGVACGDCSSDTLYLMIHQIVSASTSVLPQ